MQTMEKERIDERFDRLESSGAEFREEVRDSLEGLRTQLRAELREESQGLRDDLRAANTELRTEIREANLELRMEIQATNVRFDALQRTLMQIGTGLIGTTVLAFIGVIAAQL